MTERSGQHHLRLAAAYVRGALGGRDLTEVRDLVDLPLGDLSRSDMTRLVDCGRRQGLRLHRFKRTRGLPRVKRVLGILKGVQPGTVLDIGSGRGTALWPMLEELESTPVTAIDASESRAKEIQIVADGGVTGLRACHMDARVIEFADDEFDVVTMFEVLEHIADAEVAAREAVRVARRFVIASVPSKPDSNPHHVRLFSGETLEEMFLNAGAAGVNVSYVLNHTIAVVRI